MSCKIFILLSVVAWASCLLPAFAFLTKPVPSRRQPSSLRVSASSDGDRKKNALPTVEFVDPETECRVVLLGCFHGTESSAKDVEEAVTADTDIVALELCTSRFVDLKREMLKEQNEELQSERKPWLVDYWNMVSKTTSQRGLPTGFAAAVLGGFSGVQSALSGFSPGLEFTRALEMAESYNCEIILADQDVDETLRRVGSLPQISVENLLSNDRFDRWRLHQETLLRAVAGIGSGKTPQVQLPMFLIRNPSAIQDLLRLTIPPTLAMWTVILGTAAIAGIDLTANSVATQAYYEAATPIEQVLHTVTSTGILALGYVGLALPAVGVILTERDDILANGIKTACRRAGKGGKVVAILGLLHVNSVAAKVMGSPSESETV